MLELQFICNCIMTRKELPIPPHFRPAGVGEVWKVDYHGIAREAAGWRLAHRLPPVAGDRSRIALLIVDVQNTFCIPGFELFVAGSSGTAAVDDNRRLCRFIYRNLHRITRILPTMDTHQAFQIFHGVFLEDREGRHPEPYSMVGVEDLEEGKWRVSEAVCVALGLDFDYVKRHVLHYAQSLRSRKKYAWTIWPYHAMLGGIGHALVSAVEEAIFFHAIARLSQPDFQIKGQNALTEHYSLFGPEVLDGPEGDPIGERNRKLIETLKSYDRIVVAGQAKSHCVAWTVEDLLQDPEIATGGLAAKFYLLEDCTSPVVIPGVVDYTDQAAAAFERFRGCGMQLVDSETPMESWPGFSGRE